MARLRASLRLGGRLGIAAFLGVLVEVAAAHVRGAAAAAERVGVRRRVALFHGGPVGADLVVALADGAADLVVHVLTLGARVREVAAAPALGVRSDQADGPLLPLEL